MSHTPRANRLRPWLAGLLLLVPVAAALADVPAHEPAVRKQLTKAQRTRISQRKKEQQVIRSYYGVDIDQAVRLTGQMLQRDIAAFGEDHVETAKAANFASGTLWRARKLKLSIDLQKDEGRIYAKVYGQDNWRVASVVSHLRILERLAGQGNALRDQYGTAWEAYDQAWELFEADQPARGLAAAERARNLFIQTLRTIGVPPEETTELSGVVKALARGNNDLGRFQKAEELARESMALAARAYGMRLHPEYADRLVFLASVHDRRAQYAQAELALREALEILEKCYDTPHRAVARLCATLGRNYQDQGKYALAEETYKRGLEIWKQSDEPWPVTYSSCLEGVGTVCRLTGRLDQAEEHHREDLEFVEKKFGATSTNYAVSVNGLAQVLYTRKDYKEALKSYSTALGIYASKYGKKHPYYAIVLSNVGDTRGRLRQYKKAETDLRASLVILAPKLGERHPTTTGVRNTLCNLFERLGQERIRAGKLDLARESLDKLLAARIEFNGEQHWTVQAARSELAYLEALEKKSDEERERLAQATTDLEEAASLVEQSKQAEALPLLEKAAAARRELLGEGSALTADALLRLADTCHAVGRKADAEKHYRTAGIIYEKLWPNTDLPPGHADACARIADYCRRRGDPGQAMRLGDLARARYKQLYGEGSGKYTAALLEAGRLRREQGDPDRAEVLFRELVDLRTKYVGKQSPLYAEALEELATLLRLSNKLDQAEPLLLEALRLTAPEMGTFRLDNIRIRNQLGLVYLKGGRRALAEAAFQRCRDDYGKGFRTDDFNYAAYLNNLGAVQLDNGDLSRAESNLRTALDVLTALNEPRDRTLLRLVRITEDRAWAQRAADKPEAAREARAEVLALLDRHAGSKHWRTALAREQLADAVAFEKLPAEKRELLRRADAAAREAAARTADGKFAEALTAAQRTCDLREEAVGPQCLELAADLGRLADLCERLGRNREAVAAYDKAIALRVARLGPAHPATADLGSAAGQLALRAGDGPAAAAAFARAATAYARELGARSAEYGLTLCRQGQAVLRQGDPARAEGLLRHGHRVLQPLQNDEVAAYCLARQGLAEWALAIGDAAQARVLLAGAEALARRYLSDPGAVLLANYRLMAAVHRLQGRPRDAETEAIRVRDLTRQLYGDQGTAYADALAGLAAAKEAMGQRDDAESLLRQAATLYDRALGEGHAATAGILHTLGVLHARRGDAIGAEPLLRRALELERKQGATAGDRAAECQRDLGDLMRQTGRSDLATQLYGQFLAHCRTRLEAAAATQTEQQQIALARHLRQALDRRLSLPASAGEVEGLYADVLAWKGAAYARHDLLRAARGKPELEPLFQRFEDISHRLATQAALVPYPEERAFWAQRVEQLARDREETAAEVRRRAYADGRPQPATPEQVRKVLPIGTALVDLVEYERRTPGPGSKGYWNIERALTAFVLRGGRPVERIDLGPVSDIEPLIRTWRDDSVRLVELIFAVSRARNREEVLKQLREVEERIRRTDADLSRIVWGKLADALRGAETLLIAPDGQLALFPFSALQTGPDHFLIEDMAVAIVPVPALLPAFLAARREERALPSLLAMGGIDYSAAPEDIPDTRPRMSEQTLGSVLFPRGAVKQLALTGPEVDAVAGLFARVLPDATVHKLLGRRASERAFRDRLASARWLYLSTHGFYGKDTVRRGMERIARLKGIVRGGEVAEQTAVVPSVLDDPGLMTGLMFAGASEAHGPDQDDGILWALEVAALDLRHVDLAVLSACQTAEGEVTGGEGVMSLQRAFHTAGARAVISTLWPAQELGSKLLMERFMDNVLRKKMSKLEAMTECQRWMIRAARAYERGGTSDLTWQSERLPSVYMLPNLWAVFVLSGDWR
jgi:CHAT domain-containing protein